MDLNSLSPKHLLNDGLLALKKGAEAVKTAPSELATEIKELLPERLLLHPKLPPYTPLSAAARVAAEQRSVGMTYPQPFITNKSGTRTFEPVNLVMTGSRAEIIHALTKAGWTQTASLTTSSGLKSALTMIDGLTPLHHLIDYNYKASPVSPMYLDGRHFDLAFNKNDQHNLARDHLRIFETPRRDAAGRPIWEVAATRDVGLHIGTKSHGHAIDQAIDKERDQVLADLLKSGEVQQWHVAKSEVNPSDPRFKDYQTDHKLYTVDLVPHPGLRVPDEHHQNFAHQVINHAPDLIRDAEKGLDSKLSNLFKSLNGGA